MYHDTDEFYEGRYPIGDAITMNRPIVAYVRLLDTGEYFDSLEGDIDLYDVRGGGISGTARFRAESDEVFGDYHRRGRHLRNRLRRPHQPQPEPLLLRRRQVPELK